MKGKKIWKNMKVVIVLLVNDIQDRLLSIHDASFSVG